MRFEIPELKRCCFCIPLRRGLIFWVYMNLTSGFLLLCFFIDALISIISRSGPLFAYFIVTISLIVTILEIIFSIVFIISAHRKNPKYMRIYYRYAIFLLIIEVIAMLILVGLDIYTVVMAMPYSLFVLQNILEFNSALFILIVLQSYLIILVRSEVLKLERVAKFEFINHTSEPECIAQIIP